MSAAGVLCGLGAGAGLVLAVPRLPVFRRPSLADRVDPYVSPRRGTRRLAPGDSRAGGDGAIRVLLQPTLVAAAGILDEWLGGRVALSRRLERAGRAPDVDAFRVEQVGWGVAGLALAVAAAVGLATAGRSVRLVPPLLLAAVCACAGALLRDRALQREVSLREQRILAEFPTIAELIALSVAAGEGVQAALQRAASVGRGELANELDRTMSEVRVGVGLVEALRSLTARTAVAPLARFVDGLVIAVERGTPLADVLRAQAADVREAGARALIESAGRREIAMMVPVVFLVLPVSVLFALFPGFYGLSLAAS